MHDAPERHVSTPARVFVCLAATLGAWQVAWIIADADRLSLRLPGHVDPGAVPGPRLTHEPIELPPDHPGQLSLDLDP